MMVNISQHMNVMPRQLINNLLFLKMNMKYIPLGKERNESVSDSEAYCGAVSLT